MSFKPIDAKRDEYRKYLERTGVLEMLSKVIVKLCECPERPENAIDFIRSNMGDAMLERDTIEHLKRELEDSRNEVAQLKRQLEALRLENASVKPSPIDNQSNAETIVDQTKDESNEINTSEAKSSFEKEFSEENETGAEISSDKEEKEASNEKSSTNVQTPSGNVENNASTDEEGKDATATIEPESNKE